MMGPASVEPTSPGSESDLGALRRLLGTDGVELVEQLDRITHDPEREGTAEAHEVAGDLATWMLVTYRELVRDARTAGSSSWSVATDVADPTPADHAPSASALDAALGPRILATLAEHDAVLSDIARLGLHEWSRTEADQHVLAAMGERLARLRAGLAVELGLRRGVAVRDATAHGIGATR